MAYLEAADLREWVGVGDGGEDALLDAAISAASAWIDDWCGQSFELVDPATQRVFVASCARTLHLAPPSRIASTDDLVVATDDNDDGSFETTWSASDYALEPAAGYVGTVQRPYRTLRAISSRTWPASRYGRPLVRVTAHWGWATTPAPVTHACKVLAAQLWKVKDAPLGVAGFGDMGLIRIRENPLVESLLAPFVENARLA